MHVYKSADETSIEGSVSELLNIAKYIQRAKTGTTKTYELSLRSTAEPYDELLEQLVLDCNGSKIKGAIFGKTLLIEFSEETAEMMASFFVFEQKSVYVQYYHFDQHGNEDFFHRDSIDMVIQVEN